MNKAAAIGAIIAVIIGIAIVSAVVPMDSSVENEDSASEEIVIEESIEEEVVIEESIEEPVVDEEGRDLSVEFTESIKLKTP